MKEQKKGGRLVSPVVCALAAAVVAAIYIFVILWSVLVEPIQLPFLLFLLLIPAVILLGVIYAMRSRAKDLQNAEDDPSGD